MVRFIVNCSVMKPSLQPIALAEMPPLYSALYNRLLLCNPMENVLYRRFLHPIMVARAKHCSCSDLPLFLALHCLLDGLAIDIYPLQKIIDSIHASKVRSANWYFGVLAGTAWDHQGSVTRHMHRLLGIAYPHLA